MRSLPVSHYPPHLAVPVNSRCLAGITPIGPSKDKEELANKAREHNFPAPQAYDYEAYAARNPGPAPVDMSEGPAWASDAVKYEWKGDFGDIPPRDEALEAELFRNAWQMSQGEHMAQYKYEIKVDGYSEVAIHPILKVHAHRRCFPTHRIELTPSLRTV
jgi:hypothetical protein